MERYAELETMICDEIDKIADRRELNGSSLEMLDKLTHSLKSLKTIDAMDGYSEGSGMSYDRGYDRRRDGMGRYASEDRRYGEARYPERRY